MKVKTAVCSSVGIKRKINEDNFYAGKCINNHAKKYILKSFGRKGTEQTLAVCDGMGGEECGEIASKLAVKRLKDHIRHKKRIYEQFAESVSEYVMSANDDICDFMKLHSIERMGSTVALLCISPKTKEAIAANIGDSKVFLLRNGEMHKLSLDHNQAQSLVNMGIISDEEAKTHKDKSKLTQHLGLPTDEFIIEPYISDTVILQKKDVFLICSDGLTDMVSDKEIINAFMTKKSLKKTVKNLVEQANQRGGKDNLTVIAAKVV